jgi:hypothetical protein
MKRTPLLRKTPLKATRGFAATAIIKAASQSVTVEFDDNGKVRTVYNRKGLTVGRRPMATKAQKRRWADARARGCVACHLNLVEKGLARVSYGNDLEIHHLLSGGRRRGHAETICLCTYHHQGARLPYPDHGYDEHAKAFGPSFGREPRRFREVYGTDDQLLAYQEIMIVQLPPQFGPEALP